VNNRPTETFDTRHDEADQNRALPRRDFFRSSAAGLAAGAAAASGLTAFDALTRSVEAAGLPGSETDAADSPEIPDSQAIVLRGGVVLTLDPDVGDFEQADVLIMDKKIVEVRPNLGPVADAREIDCSGMIVCPGFISTHNHQYEAIQRAIISDGIIVFPGDFDQQKTSTTSPAPGFVYEAYGTVVQSIWTSGRFGSAASPQWDIGRSPYDPEDCYNAEVIASLSQLTQGITCGTDTSQSSHTPEHTDAMIEGLMAAGRRTLYDYSNGLNRDTNPPPLYKVPYGVPTSPNDFPGAVLAPGVKTGIERIANKYFTGKDQLVTLGFSGGPTVIPNLPAPYTGMTGWQLGRTFGAFLNAHNIAAPSTAITALAAGLAPFDDAILVHCTRWQDNSVAQISHSKLGYPNPATSAGMQIWSDNGGHVSVASAIEMQMRHGIPALQMCLNYGILPSLSPDVDTNMSPDPFTLMRAAFLCQRALANDLAFAANSNPGKLPIPQLVTSKQVVQMMTVAGAAGCGLKDKVGTLTPGKEADILCLHYNNINFQPMNNAYGTIVTMMDTRAVKHVFVAGRLRVWNGKLVGVDVAQVVKNAVRSRDSVLARINGPAVGTDTDIINRGKNSFGHPYRPAFLTSCCHNGLNEFAPQYVLRP
jgi:5-methylthioadenosine/S-adenosylhomocysteine deaminase